MAVPTSINAPMHCVDYTDAEMEEQALLGAATHATETEVRKDGVYEKLLEVKCTSDHRYCSAHGVAMVVCICESDPVELLNLETIREYCWFATMSVAKMDNRLKRNMLYWWYMTNTYNVCGKGNRKDPPACLKESIRKCYPSEDGWYMKFNPVGNNNNAKKQSKKKSRVV